MRTGKCLFLITLFLSLFGPITGWGQIAVTLDQWPAHLQLYPRDQTNQCTVAISGRVPVNDVKTVSLVVLRNQQRVQYVRQAADTLTGRFALKPSIKAERSEYSFQLFAHRTNPVDSVLVAFRDSIVCGDVYLIMGQSNALGGLDGKLYRSEFCRTFGVNKGDVSYNPADTAWYLTNTTEGFNCLWAVELQRQINEQYGIPTAILNGAVGSTGIDRHASRDGNQPTNLGTIYGRLLYRAQKAGVARQVKAMIWRQGESDAVTTPDLYIKLYPELYSFWKQDYPGLKKVYHAQLNLLVDNFIRAGALRNYQRLSKQNFADNEPIATVGLPGYQGVHYNDSGYLQFGLELYRLVARDFYGSTDTSNIQSPNIQRLFFSTPKQDEITLEFEPGQVMHWPADTILTNPVNKARYAQSLSDYVYTDYPNGETGFIKSVTDQGNRLILKLKKSLSASSLTYLPSSYTDAEIGYYVGPVIRNRRGMRALTFYQVPIAPPLPVATDLRAIPIDTSAIELRWTTTSADVSQWTIERADSTDSFRQIALIPGSVTAYNDRRTANRADSLQVGKVYQYRIRSLNQRAEADYSPVVTASMQLILGTPKERYLPAVVYPNPTGNEVQVRLPPNWAASAVTLTVYTEAGAAVFRQSQRMNGSYLSFSVATLPAGTYLLTLQHRDGLAQGRVLVTH
ncbi:sialate O-acetylesterase [Spirosoma endophyticum]|uniref:Por secretion system C-terminal sorting domain-containing protein n=1 Tax=Spirosoma endophyticum TaxID=662367 RepID=A0A1I2CY76_9BACT|nr:sialate O-acetylesterase [Spirosoma endophyticum]SFE73267.1 Por secretion system C-terminal sorting domain-containing protein [Spirosoma endophyticum]